MAQLLEKINDFMLLFTVTALVFSFVAAWENNWLVFFIAGFCLFIGMLYPIAISTIAHILNIQD